MPHFYVKPENIIDNTFIIENEQAHYVAKVRRFGIDDTIMIFDGTGNSYEAKITAISKNSISGSILNSSYKLPKIIINLFTAIPKGERFEWLIEKCGEIGISQIVPINTKRSVTTSFSKHKLERFEKISIAASSQCGRNDIMKISEPLDFNTACKIAVENKNFISVLPWESQGDKTVLAKILKESKSANINIFIGPEGGFENEEIDFAMSLGIKPVSLGENILRVETAAIVASILTLNAFGLYGE